METDQDFALCTTEDGFSGDDIHWYVGYDYSLKSYHLCNYGDDGEPYNVEICGIQRIPTYEALLEILEEYNLEDDEGALPDLQIWVKEVTDYHKEHGLV